MKIASEAKWLNHSSFTSKLAGSILRGKTNAITLQTSSYKLDMKHKITKIYDINSHALITMYMAFLYQILSQASFYMYL